MVMSTALNVSTSRTVKDKGKSVGTATNAMCGKMHDANSSVPLASWLHGALAVEGWSGYAAYVPPYFDLDFVRFETPLKSRAPRTSLYLSTSR